MHVFKTLALTSAAATLSLSTVFAGGCTSERPLMGYSEADFGEVPDGYIPTLNRYVEAAELDGAIAGTVFDVPARIRAARGTGTVAIELAASTPSGAVMHMFDIDETVLGSLEPGQTITYAMADNSPVMLPMACAGPVVDDWAVDVLIEELTLSVTEADDGSWFYDWRMVTWLETPDGDIQENSAGRFVALPEGAAPAGVDTSTTL